MTRDRAPGSANESLQALDLTLEAPRRTPRSERGGVTASDAGLAGVLPILAAGSGLGPRVLAPGRHHHEALGIRPYSAAGHSGWQSRDRYEGQGKRDGLEGLGCGALSRWVMMDAEDGVARFGNHRRRSKCRSGVGGLGAGEVGGDACKTVCRRTCLAALQPRKRFIWA